MFQKLFFFKIYIWVKKFYGFDLRSYFLETENIPKTLFFEIYFWIKKFFSFDISFLRDRAFQLFQIIIIYILRNSIYYLLSFYYYHINPIWLIIFSQISSKIFI